MNVFLQLLFITAGFLTGSIQFSRIIPKFTTRQDICELSDDGNPGAFNAFKHCGVKVGIPCLVCDVLKGFVPVFCASLFTETSGFAFALIIAAPVLGHASGVFNGFHGGKCISVSFGVMLGLLPVTWIGITALAALYILFSTAVKIGSHLKRSIIVYCLFGVISGTALFIAGFASAACGCIAVALIAVIKHIMALNTRVEKEALTNDDK